MNFQKTIIVLAVALLFFFFARSVLDAVKESPEYSDFCSAYKGVPLNKVCPNSSPPPSLREECSAKGGSLYPANNDCPAEWKCDLCRAEYEDARLSYKKTGFVVLSVLGVLGILIGILFTGKSNALGWISIGLLLGGLLILLAATVEFFQGLDRLVRPAVLLGELLLVIYVSYSQFSKRGKLF